MGAPVIVVAAVDGAAPGAATWQPGWAAQEADATGTPTGPPHQLTDHAALADFVARREAADGPRWIWADTAGVYPPLYAAGVRVRRCYDLGLAEAALLAHSGQWGEPRSLAAAYAREHNLPVPDDPRPPDHGGQAALFESGLSDAPPGVDGLTATREVYAAQCRRVAATAEPARFGLLVTSDSAGALAAVEMTAAGLPWRADVHDALLTDLLGARPLPGARPARLAELAAAVDAAFGGRAVNPDSPGELIAAFARDGYPLTSTRSGAVSQLDHPAVPPLLAYKELARVHSAHGWAWLAEWVRDGRFRPEYVPAGVVSGRWATRGGGALQIPRRLRRAVVADPGRVLVVADAGQLEPRVLAAMSGDPAMVRAARDADLYAALAAESFGGDRDRAKVGLLGAMYGQTGGQAAAPLATLRRNYPTALALLENAARAGERGELVRSHLGRTCPPRRRPDPDEAAARSRGRFTRNFVVQASAAEWAAVLVACLRPRLAELVAAGHGAELVFFQHDEVVVHADTECVDEVTASVYAARDEATRLLFGATPVRFELHVAAAECYADAH